MEWAREDPEAVAARVEACALALYEKLQKLQFDLADCISFEVVYSPDWTLLEYPFWEDYGWQQLFIPYRVMVGIEDEFWIVLQWLTVPGSHIGHVFYPMIAAKSTITGEWTHSRKYGHDMELSPDQVELTRWVDRLVDGQLAVVLLHLDYAERIETKDDIVWTTKVGAQIFSDTDLSPVGWTEDFTRNVVNLGVLCMGQPIEQFDLLPRNSYEDETTRNHAEAYTRKLWKSL